MILASFSTNSGMFSPKSRFAEALISDLNKCYLVKAYLYMQQAGNRNESNENFLHIFVEFFSKLQTTNPSENFQTVCNWKIITKKVQRASLLIRVQKAAYQQFSLVLQRDRCQKSRCNQFLIYVQDMFIFSIALFGGVSDRIG